MRRSDRLDPVSQGELPVPRDGEKWLARSAFPELFDGIC